MKIIYKCDVCDKDHDEAFKAKNCETNHTIIKPTKYWLIPFVAWVLIPYYLFTKKNAIIIFFGKNPNVWFEIKQYLLQFWICIGPFLLFLGCLYLSLILK